jgi:hypothetical protein
MSEGGPRPAPRLSLAEGEGRVTGVPYHDLMMEACTGGCTGRRRHHLDMFGFQFKFGSSSSYCKSVAFCGSIDAI